MLIKMIADKKGTTPEARAKTALVSGVLMMLLGAAGLTALVLLGVLNIWSLEEEVNAYAHGLMFGLSGGAIGGGLSVAFSAWGRLHDPEKMRKYEIKAHDERNLAIQGAAAKMTIVTAAVVLYVMLLVSAFVRPELSMLLAIMPGGLFAIYFAWILLFSKKM